MDTAIWEEWSKEVQTDIEERRLPKKGTIAYRLMTENFHGMSINEVSEKLDVAPKYARRYIKFVLERYGYEVDCLWKPTSGYITSTKYHRYGQVVHGKCSSCYWYSSGAPCCDYNMLHFEPDRLKHGPIIEEDGGCDQYRRGHRRDSGF